MDELERDNPELEARIRAQLEIVTDLSRSKVDRYAAWDVFLLLREQRNPAIVERLDRERLAACGGTHA